MNSPAEFRKKSLDLIMKIFFLNIITRNVKTFTKFKHYENEIIELFCHFADKIISFNIIVLEAVYD